MTSAMQCKHIPDRPVLEFLASLDRPATIHDREGEVPYDHSVVRAMPDGVPQKLVRAKMAMLMRRELVDGCACGCRGDFEITRRGRAFLLPDYPDEISAEQITAIQALVDASRPAGQLLTPISTPGW